MAAEPDEAAEAEAAGIRATGGRARSSDAGIVGTCPLSPAIEPSAVYKIADLDQLEAIYAGRQQGYLYARDGNPNCVRLGQAIAELEGAEAGLICASGMGAESTALLAYLSAGDHIALARNMYGKTHRLVSVELARLGIAHDLFDPTRAESLRSVLKPRTRVVFCEALSNPLLDVADLAGLAEVSRSVGVGLLVDNTFSPLICRPLRLGATAVVHSLTKLISGHSDVTQGALVGAKEWMSRAGEVCSTFGLNGSPFDSWLAYRGLATLPLRSARACATALELAGRLAGDGRVRAVFYPGLERHPGHDRAQGMFVGGYGSILTIDLGGRERANGFIKGLKHISFAPSLGDVTTTVSHPASTSHRSLTAEERAAEGIGDGLVRLSVGLEDVGVPWGDIDQALAQISP